MVVGHTDAVAAPRAITRVCPFSRSATLDSRRLGRPPARRGIVGVVERSLRAAHWIVTAVSQRFQRGVALAPEWCENCRKRTASGKTSCVRFTTSSNLVELLPRAEPLGSLTRRDDVVDADDHRRGLGGRVNRFALDRGGVGDSLLGVTHTVLSSCESTWRRGYLGGISHDRIHSLVDVGPSRMVILPIDAIDLKVWDRSPDTGGVSVCCRCAASRSACGSSQSVARRRDCLWVPGSTRHGL